VKATLHSISQVETVYGDLGSSNLIGENAKADVILHENSQ